MRVLYILFILIFSGSACFSQAVGNPNELDKLYSPSKNPLLNTQSSEGNSSSSNYYGSYRNAIRLSPLLLTRNIFALTYERMLGTEFSLNIGLGAALRQDIIQTNTMEAAYGGNERSEISVVTMLQSGNSTGPGPYGSFALRFYLDNEGAEGNYLEINSRFSNNTIRLSDFYSIRGTSSVSIVNSGLNLIYGYQSSSSGRVQMIHDFYFGIGYKNTSYNIFKEYTEMVIDPFNGSSYEQTYTAKSAARESISYPSLMMGYTFGIGF